MVELGNRHRWSYLEIGFSGLTTYDIDLWIDKAEENGVNIVLALEEFGIPFSLEFDDFLAAESVFQIGVEPNRIDILTDIDGVRFEDAWENREVAEFGTLQAYSMGINDLIKNKSASGRPKDKLDLVQLKALAKQRKKQK